MKHALQAIAVLLIAAAAARADDLSGRALLSYESRDTDRLATTGVRQQYDLRLYKAFTMTSLMRLFCRVDDFRGLLKSSIRDENPVMFFTDMTLGYQPGEVSDGDSLVPLGQATLFTIYPRERQVGRIYR